MKLRRSWRGISQQRVKSELAVITLAVDEKRRGAVHASSLATFEILLHTRSMRAVRDVPEEARHIQMYGRCVLAQIVIVKCLLMLEQEIVHLPKLSLDASGFGRFRRALRMRMRMDQRKVAKNKAKTIPQPFLNL